MNQAFTVRRAVAADLSGIMEVETACPEAPHWTAEHYAEALLMRPDALLQRAIFVAVADERVAGFIVVSLAADEAELESIALLPEFRRQGIASGLCRASMAWAHEECAQAMWLEVRASNLAAQALYRRLGFDARGTRPHYYSNPAEDAVVMCAALRVAGHL